MDDDAHRQPSTVDQSVDFAALHLLAGVVTHLVVSTAPFSADLTDWLSKTAAAGLASLPIEPYEAALIDGASQWQMFWKITYPLVLPFLVVAMIIRTIDALKAFETIWVITNGGPGTASETLNVFLYAQAFSYNQVGTASAVVIVFFAIIVALSLVLLWARQKAKWA